MEASERPRTRTESSCTTETAWATHVFKIAGYSLQKGRGQGKFIMSATFAVGGYDWCIRYYPERDTGEDLKDWVSIYLELRSKDTEVSAIYDFRLVNQATGLSSSVYSGKTVKVFKSRASENPTWGVSKFIKRGELEGSPYLRDDCLVIECDIIVILGTPVSESKTVCEIQVPPSDLSDYLRNLLEAGEGTDVAFQVEGEIFRAHRIVLAMRSPVFKAELYGPVGENNRQRITIKDMQPAIFKELLHFIYTDSLSTMDNVGRDENEEMIKHLLVAADRYGVGRMKVTCESILAKKLDVESVATTLALADQHHCSKLKDACIEFINSSNRMEDVQASQGYPHLKRACPAVIVEIWEKATKSRKI